MITFALLVFGLAALSSAPALSQTAATLTPVSGSGQSTVVDNLFANDLKVIVQDGSGNTLVNTPVTFTAPAGPIASTATAIFNGAGNAITVNTDATGTATVPAALVRASQRAAQFNVAVASGTATTTILLINGPGAAATISISDGAGQQGTVLTGLPVTFKALLVDSFGNPAPGVGITFTAPSSGASGNFSGPLTALTTTNASGIATAPAFTLNAISGVFNVQANTTVAPLTTPANFNLVSTPSTPTQISISQGSPQSTVVLTNFATTLRALIRDANNNPVPNVNVTFTAPTTGASATFLGGNSTVTVATDASGFALATTLTANAVAGTYNVSATFSSGPTINFAMTNTPGAAASLDVNSGNNQSATITLNFASSLSIIVRDGGGNVVPGAVVTFTAPGSGASGLFGASATTTATTNASGIATTSTQFRANAIAGTYSITVTYLSLTTTFTMTNVNPSAIIVNGGSGQSATITTAYATPLSARVTDAGGNGIPGLTVTFTAPGSGASGLFGASAFTTAITNASGIATATTFTANATAGSVTVNASVTGVVAPAAFSLTNDNPAAIAVQAGSSQQATINTAFPALMSARVTNTGGIGIAGLTVTFTAPSSGASGSFAGLLTRTAVTNASGIATATAFTANATVGAFTVDATVNGVGAPAQFNMTNLTPTPASIAASPTGSTPQSVSINGVFGTALGVIIRDINGIVLNNIPVTFTVNPVGGADATFAGGLTTFSGNTNASGILTATALTANGTAGAYTVTATAGSLTFTFNLTNQTAASIAATGGTPQTTLINTNFGAQLSATVRDGSNSPIAGASVTFTVPGLGASGLFGASVTSTVVTNASGIANSGILTANATVGSFTATATVAGGGTANFALTNTAPASIAATGGVTQSAVINTNFGVLLQATVRDATNAPVANATVTFTAPASGASGLFGALITHTATTNVSGVATATAFTANATVGAYIVTASVSGVATTAEYNLNNTLATPVTAVASPSNGSPQSTAINTAFATALGVLVRDGGGAIIANLPVTFTVNPVGGSAATFAGGLSTIVVNTNGSGISTAPTLTANGVAGTYTVTATVGSLTVTFSLSNTQVIATIELFGGNNQSAVIATGFANTLQARVLDGGGNPVAGAVVVFAAPTTGARATFSGASTATATTNASGVATPPAALAGTVTGTYAVTATVQATAISTAFSLTNTPGAAATIAVVSGNGQSAALGADYAQVLVAVVRDGSGNVIPGASVTFNAPTSGARATFAGGLASTTVTTDGSGNATSTIVTAVGATGSVTLNARVNNTSPSVNFTLTNTGAVPGSVAVQTGSGQTTMVNTNFGTTLQARVLDTLGNPTAGVTVTFAVPTSGASGIFNGSVTAVTNASGIATSPTLRANTTTGTFFAQASVLGIASPALYSLTNTPDAPVAISIVQGTPQTTFAGTPFATALVARVNDVYGNPVPGAPVTFLAPTVGSIASFPGMVSSTIATTDANGRATAATLTANAIAGTYTVTASIATGTSVNYNLTNTPAPTSISAVGASTQTTPVTTAFATALEVTVRDATNLPVPGVTVTFAAPTTGATGVLSVLTATTNASGVASITVTANAIAGTYSVTATVAGIATPLTFNLTNTAGTPSSLNATGGVTQSTLVTTAFGTALEVVVRDGSNNPVPGVTVAFAVPASGASSILSATSVTTNALGVASVTATANSTAGAYVVSATVVGIPTPISFNLTNTVGAPASISATGGVTQSTLVTTAFGTALQVTVRDGSNNPVQGVAVTFTPPAAGASSVLSSTTVTTNALGVASVTATANSTAGAYVVSATVVGIPTPISFNLTNTVGAPASISATGGVTQSTLVTTAFGTALQVTVRDGSNNPVQGVAVTFTPPAAGASSVLSSTTVTTNALGVASVTATANSTAGAYVVSATVVGIATPISFNLTNTVGAPTSISATGGGTQSTVVTTAFGTALQVTVRDGSNNPVQGVAVTFTPPASGASSVLSATTVTTNALGVASVTATANSTAGAYVVSATVVGIATPISFNLTNTVGAPASISATGGGTQSTLVTTAFGTALEVTVRDGSNNPVPGVTVTFAAPKSGASSVLSSTSVVTNASGVASVTATANTTVGTYSVTASVAGIATPIGFSLTNTGTAGLTLAVTGSPTLISGPGQSVVFTYVLTNTGTVAISTLVLNDTNVPGIVCPATTLAVNASMTCTATYISTTADITNGGITSVAQATGTTVAGSPTSPVVTTRVGVDADAIRRRTVDANKRLMEDRARVLTSMAPNAQRLHNRLTSPLFGDGEDDAADAPESERHEPLKIVGTPGSAIDPRSASLGGRIASILEPRQPNRHGGIAEDAGLPARHDGRTNKAQGPAPFSFSGDADDSNGRFNFATSLSQMRTISRSEQAAKLGVNGNGAAQASKGKHEDLFDVWVEGQAAYFKSDQGGARRQGHAAVMYAGVDAIVRPGIAVGVLLQRDWVSEHSTGSNQNSDGAGWMAGPYIGMRLTKNLYFDARYAWGEATNNVNPIGAYTDTFKSTRELASARLTGDWVKGAWRFRPMVDATYFKEQQKAYVNQIGITIPETSVKLGRVTFGPEFAYRMQLSKTSFFEPYLGIKGVYDFAKDKTTTASGSTSSPDDFTARLEIGASYTAPSGVSLRASGTYDGLLGADHRAITGQAFVIVPLQ